jgi:hypothetical protein
MFAQVSHMRKELDACPRPQIGTLRMHVTLLTEELLTIDEVANCLQTRHGSAYEIIHIQLGFQKDGSQDSSQCACTSGNNIRIAGNKCDAYLESTLVMIH